MAITAADLQERFEPRPAPHPRAGGPVVNDSSMQVATASGSGQSSNTVLLRARGCG